MHLTPSSSKSANPYANFHLVTPPLSSGPECTVDLKLHWDTLLLLEKLLRLAAPHGTYHGIRSTSLTIELASRLRRAFSYPMPHLPSSEGKGQGGGGAAEEAWCRLHLSFLSTLAKCQHPSSLQCFFRLAMASMDSEGNPPASRYPFWVHMVGLLPQLFALHEVLGGGVATGEGAFASSCHETVSLLFLTAKLLFQCRPFLCEQLVSAVVSCPGVWDVSLTISNLLTGLESLGSYYNWQAWDQDLIALLTYRVGIIGGKESSFDDVPLGCHLPKLAALVFVSQLISSCTIVRHQGFSPSLVLFLLRKLLVETPLLDRLVDMWHVEPCIGGQGRTSVMLSGSTLA